MRILFFILLSFNAFSQSDFTEAYFPKVNQAELMICDGKYSEASQIYEEAFEAVKTPLAKDIYNNLVCAVLTGNVENTKKMLFKLARKGISPDFFSKRQIYNLQEFSNLWTGFKPVFEQISSSLTTNLESEYDNNEHARKEIVHKLDDLNKEISVLEAMQKIDNPNDSTEISRIETALNKLNQKINDERVLLSKEISKNSEFILGKHGILSEEESNISKDNGFNTDFYFTLKWYFYYDYQKTNTLNPDLLRPYVVKAIKKGIISPISAIRLLKEGDKYRKYQPKIFTLTFDEGLVCDLLKYQKINTSMFYKVSSHKDFNEEEYKTFCDIFSLPSLADRTKKVIYASMKNQYFYFEESVYVENATVSNCEMAEEMLQNAVVIQP